MIERALLKVLEDKSNYSRFSSVLGVLSRETGIIVKNLGEYFEHNEELSWPDFASWFFQVKHPSMKEDQCEIYRTVFESLESAESTHTEEQIAEALKERAVFTEVGNKALRIAEGTGDDPMEIYLLLDDYKQNSSLLSEVESLEVTHDFEELVDSITVRSGLEWRLEELNLSLGPVNKGDLVLVAARPEVGKTTFLTSEISYMLSQTDGDVLWFANEEAGTKVRWRIIQAITGMTTQDIIADKPKALKLYKDLGGERVRLIDKKEFSIHDVERLLETSNPALIVYDQLRFFKGFEGQGTDVERLKHLYRKARAYAEYAPSIVVHQARGDAEGQLYLTQQQLEGTQTEVQGAVDAMIMIGKSHDASLDPMLRGLSIVKNKLTGGARSDPSLRHGTFEVEIQPEIARYTSKVHTNPNS